MADLEKGLGLALGEQQVESLTSTPTSPSPRSVEAPQDEIQCRERSETTLGRQEELRDASRHGTPAQDLEWWEQRETDVLVERGAVAMQQQVELAAQKEDQLEATEALPAAQLKIPVIDQHRFRLRGVRARQLAGRQTKTTQYRVIWGEYSNRSDSWFNEDDVQILMLEFKLPSISDRFHLPINPPALDINHDAAAHSKIHQAPLKPKKSKILWTKEEDIRLLQMWNEGRSWEYIFAALPRRSAIRVRCSTKFKKRSRTEADRS
ncbi:hypothetical protein BKA61DRAFT_740071 [Leptodontidium sp. MPI-SDFR-AT-0119]|nr:hypothetical protein BKA61DRAFT_740071 [Leptodontidium sp. MPI-SDFR-AT-0119]